MASDFSISPFEHSCCEAPRQGLIFSSNRLSSPVGRRGFLHKHRIWASVRCHEYWNSDCWNNPQKFAVFQTLLSYFSSTEREPFMWFQRNSEMVVKCWQGTTKAWTRNDASIDWWTQPTSNWHNHGQTGPSGDLCMSCDDPLSRSHKGCKASRVSTCSFQVARTLSLIKLESCCLDNNTYSSWQRIKSVSPDSRRTNKGRRTNAPNTGHLVQFPCQILETELRHLLKL